MSATGVHNDDLVVLGLELIHSILGDLHWVYLCVAVEININAFQAYVNKKLWVNNALNLLCHAFSFMETAEYKTILFLGEKNHYTISLKLGHTVFMAAIRQMKVCILAQSEVPMKFCLLPAAVHKKHTISWPQKLLSPQSKTLIMFICIP